MYYSKLRLAYLFFICLIISSNIVAAHDPQPCKRTIAELLEHKLLLNPKDAKSIANLASKRGAVPFVTELLKEIPGPYYTDYNSRWWQQPFIPILKFLTSQKWQVEQQQQVMASAFRTLLTMPFRDLRIAANRTDATVEIKLAYQLITHQHLNAMKLYRRSNSFLSWLSTATNPLALLKAYYERRDPSLKQTLREESWQLSASLVENRYRKSKQNLENAANKFSQSKITDKELVDLEINDVKERVQYLLYTRKNTLSPLKKLYLTYQIMPLQKYLSFLENSSVPLLTKIRNSFLHSSAFLGEYAAKAGAITLAWVGLYYFELNALRWDYYPTVHDPIPDVIVIEGKDSIESLNFPPNSTEQNAAAQDIENLLNQIQAEDR